MKTYSHTALGLLLCSATVTGCYSERIKYIQNDVRGDAGVPTVTPVPPANTDTSESNEPKTGHQNRTDESTGIESTEGPGSSDSKAVDSTSPVPSGTADTSSPLTSDGDPTSTDAPAKPPEDSFLALPPGDRDSNGNAESPGSPGSGGDATSGSPPAAPGSDPSGESLEQVITEADILKRNGDIVYALSYVAGLAVIDVSDPTNLLLLGSRRFEETPFEMYLDGDEAVVLFHGSSGTYSDYYGGYVDTTEKSKIGVYSVTNPSTLTEIDSAEIDGSLIDSRKIGDRLYVATNSYCYWCDNGGARVGSFNLAGTGIAPVAEVQIPEEGSWGYAPTLYVNDQRLYLARMGWGYVDDEGNPISEEEIWGSSGDTGSTVPMATVAGPVELEPPAAVDTGATITATAATADSIDSAPIEADGGVSTPVNYHYGQWSSLQVVDISDTSGALTLGSKVRIEGQVTNRWQMDEHEGVLRVISQNGWWGPAPVVETFTVGDSSNIAALGRTELALPTQESLQSVRFDGDRAFAVTFLQTDPLFTLDLTDPANPKQVGELEMPGFLYHMIPRGDRLYAIGYDNGAANSLHASVFDVSDLANPQLLSRVNFGGNWGWFGEDQDRIEKSVQLLDEQGLMLIPYTGYDYAGGCGWGETRSGVQLIDFSRDALTLRGATDAVGYARRAFYHRDHLFAYSDRALQSYDISNRDQPVAVDALALGWYVESVAAVGDNLVRVGTDGLDHPVMDVVPLTTPNAPLQPNALALREEACGYSYYEEPIIHEGKLLLPRQGYDYTLNTRTVAISAYDISGASGPTLVREVTLPTMDSDYYGTTWFETNNALVALQTSETWEWVPTSSSGVDGGVAASTGELPNNPVVTATPPSAPAVSPTPVATVAAVATVTIEEASPAEAGDAGAPVTWDEYDYDNGYGYGGYSLYSRSARVSVIDLRDIAGEMPVTSLDVPQDWIDQGFGQGPSNVGVAYTGANAGAWGLVAGGDVVASQHAVEEGNGVRYFADRLDVSDPSTPTWLPQANIPGPVLSLAQDDVHLVTVDEVVLPLSEAECVENEYNDFLACYNRAVQLSALTLESNRAVRTATVRLGTNRQWFTLAQTNDAIYVAADAVAGVRAYSQELAALGSLPTEGQNYSYLTTLAGHVANYSYEPRGYTLYSTAGNALHSVGFLNLQTSGWCYAWSIDGDDVYCANGYRGVVHTTLE